MVAALEVSVLALIAWPILRAVAHPALRRAFPRTATMFAFLLLAGGMVVVCILLWVPRLLHLLTVLAVGAVLYVLWNARTGRERSRPIPPGSLSWLPFDYITDPFFFQKQFDQYGSVFKMSQFGVGAGPNPFRGLLQPVCCVKLERGIGLLREHDKRLVPPANPASRFIPQRYLREMSPKHHRHYRQIFSSAFVPGVVDESEAFLAEHVRGSLIRMAEVSASRGNRGIAPEQPLTAMTFGVFVRCFYGIFPDDQRFGRLEELFRAIELSNRNDHQVTLALDELAQTLRQEAQRIRASGRDLPQSFLGELSCAQQIVLDDLTAMRNLIYITHASWIDTAGLVVWLFKELCDHPDWAARLSASKATSEGDGDELSVRIVKETLRLRQSEYIYRKVLEDIHVAGYVVPSGWLLRICVRESHRDPRVFADPNTFNPDRFLAHRYTREQYSTFGASRISCLGEHLTMTVGRIFVEEMAGTIETSVLKDGPLEYRRWHWKPSSKWKVRVTRLARSPGEIAVGRRW